MKKTSMGLDENIAVFLCYLCWWVSGLIILLIEKDNKVVKFHAVQSMVTFGAIYILQSIFGYSFRLGFSFIELINIAALVLWVFLLVKAWGKEYIKLPIVGDISEQISNNINK